MSVDWERRRTNLRILIAAANTNATKLSEAAGLSPNTISKFVNGSTGKISEDSLQKILPVLGLSSATDLDTDNPLSDPRGQIRRLLEGVPESEVLKLLDELRERYGPSQ